MLRQLLLSFLLLITIGTGNVSAQSVVGTHRGCVDYTSAAAAWTTLTSASLENMAGSTALPAGLYWMESLTKDGSGPVYLCDAPAASCGVGTGNKQAVVTGAALTTEMRGLGVKSISVYAGIGVTVQICGIFRKVP